MRVRTTALILAAFMVSGSIAQETDTADPLALDQLEARVETLLKHHPDVDWTTALRTRLKVAYPERDDNSLTDALILAVNSRSDANRVLVISAKLDVLRDRLAPTLTWQVSVDGLTAARDMYVRVVSELKVKYEGLQAVLTDLNEIRRALKPVPPIGDKAKDEVTANKPVAAKQGRVVINNPTRFELQLLVNNAPVRVQPLGVTSFTAPVGAVTTQVGNFPQTRKAWNNWSKVGEEDQLRITVRSTGNQYWLQ